MPDDKTVLSFSERLAQRRAERGEQPVSKAPTADDNGLPQWSTDLIPQVSDNAQKTVWDELNQVVDNVDIVQAYIRWCGKMVPDVGGKTESIMISCPKPNHRDNNPSAWLNTDKQTWFCGTCQEGGDKYDIAAWKFGYPVPGYKKDHFTDLRKDIASDLGYHVEKVAGGFVLNAPGTATQEVNDPVPAVATPQPSASAAPEEAVAVPQVEPASDATGTGGVTELRPAINLDDDDDEAINVKLDWRAFVPPNSFIGHYMEAACLDDSPEEYHFWHAMAALGLTVGRRVTLDDTKPVLGNMMICLLGPSGSGKSKSRYYLNTVLDAVVPYKELGDSTVGVKHIGKPGSGEYLIRQFQYIGKDPGTNTPLGHTSVTGLTVFDEFDEFLSRSGRLGSTLKPILMQFADGDPNIKTGSLTGGEWTARDSFCSVLTSTQPRSLRFLLNKQDSGSGFLNRWVFAAGIPKEKQIIGGRRSSFTVSLDQAIADLKDIKLWAGVSEKRLYWSDDAADAFTYWMKMTVLPTMEADDSDLLSRVDLHMKRFAMLFAINERSDEVLEHHVTAVKYLYTYMVSCFEALDVNINRTVIGELDQKIQKICQKFTERQNGRGASARDIYNYTNKKYSIDLINRTLKTMIDLQLIALQPAPTGPGRKTARYEVVGA